MVVDFDFNHFGAIDFDLIYKSFSWVIYDFDLNKKLSDQLQHWVRIILQSFNGFVLFSQKRVFKVFILVMNVLHLRVTGASRGQWVEPCPQTPDELFVLQKHI